MNLLKQFIARLFQRVTPQEAAARELYEAEMQRLRALTAMEYASSMVQYHDSRILRLRDFMSKT